MKILSFAWTTPALLAHRKTVTRRDWRPRHARLWCKGDLARAYDRLPYHGGRPLGVIRLTHYPALQLTTVAPPSDYAAEGFEYLEAIGATVNGLVPSELWRRWHDPDSDQAAWLWVVRFEIISLNGPSA